MPKRTDIKKILIIGAGPIVIGQACEFDYSGVQACKALKEEGYEIVLVNSNPATIMTDPEMAHRTYIEPITPAVVAKIIERERPDALLPTMGGQTALNTAVALAEMGVLEKYKVELIGAKLPAIKKAEDRELFKKAMEKIGLEVPKSGFATNLDQAYEILEMVGFPAILRPAFTLGGTGGGIAYNREEFTELITRGLEASPVRQVLIEQSVVGWKEYELEVMRDTKDNVVIVCSIENFDPMGIHTGDSITVAPAQTLTDKEYQIMRDASLKIIREIGVDTGGSNIQFGVNPDNGRLVVIEMNPRVSRSSALASKATGFAIAKIAAKLAVGFTLDEITNDITKATPASFEPTIDYVVTKFPRFAFEKFPQADATLTTQMKSVGEAMSIGRTFKESFQKALRSLEIDRYGIESRRERDGDVDHGVDEIRQKISVPNWERIWYIADGFRLGMGVDEVFNLSKIDPWFLHQIKQIVDFEKELRDHAASILTDKSASLDHPLRRAKEYGFSDRRLAKLFTTTEDAVRKARYELGILPVFKTVDTCAAEFEAHTPYLYSTYEKPFYRVQGPGAGGQSKASAECEANPTDRKKVVILGGGPNRIGQGIEFDYCCVHAAFALKDDGYETIMVNCNPETVSTDYDTSDRLYFEPLTLEDVLHIIRREKPMGVIVQFGGQTPLKLAVPLEKEGVRILGTTPDSIDRAEDRKRFKELLDKLGLLQAESGTAVSCDEAVDAANRIGYPVMVRPSYVLGGRAMEIVYDEESVRNYMTRAVKASPERPVLVDKYLEDAIEIDVDAISDGKMVVVAGIMEHIEEAGVHSGDSACSLPPFSLSESIVKEIDHQARALALELGVVGLMNIQFAVKEGRIYVLEVNPRASRTVPFVSKAIGVPLAKLAARVMAGKTLPELGFTKTVSIKYIAVKEAVFPFAKFPGVDTLLGPEMKSTGEVMGIDTDFGMSFAKSQMAAGNPLPISGRVFLSVKDKDKAGLLEVAQGLEKAGFSIVATRGTADYLRQRGITVETVNKVTEGRPHIVDQITDMQIDLVINTVYGAQSQKDSYSIRRTTLVKGVPYFTTISAAKAAVRGISAIKANPLQVKSIQEYHRS
ncbi:MAG: carbamoyl-phosphate synthase large subunit [Nitrospiraceae bacterium]|nr:carbamoyl-phosphate synthase large subunit [Nitrospiraceae bacterium]